tara:strand:- start:846 stop:1025 length:180 start_codon:yes stop_codon:yes gene_type:complete
MISGLNNKKRSRKIEIKQCLVFIGQVGVLYAVESTIKNKIKLPHALINRLRIFGQNWKK